MSSAEYSVHLVGVNRLSVSREFCGVHSWQLNGTSCRDGVKLLWCHSMLENPERSGTERNGSN